MLKAVGYVWVAMGGNVETDGCYVGGRPAVGYMWKQTGFMWIVMGIYEESCLLCVAGVGL